MNAYTELHAARTCTLHRTSGSRGHRRHRSIFWCPAPFVQLTAQVRKKVYTGHREGACLAHCRPGCHSEKAIKQEFSRLPPFAGKPIAQ